MQNTIENPSYYFRELQDALEHLPDYSGIYAVYNRVFTQCLNDKTSHVPLHLCGNFAKTDYLLKETHASVGLARQINDTRVRLRNRTTVSPKFFEQHYLADLRNLAEFIAHIYSIDVPKELRVCFPFSEREQVSHTTLLSDCMRMVADSWDEKYVYGTVDCPAISEEVKVCYSKSDAILNFDWAYLRNLYYRGAQINLLRVHQKDGVLYPEIIIFEPDYLVDISAIANCFTDYAESPYVHLLNKLKPIAQSEAVVLGNFAGQLLDEQIHKISSAHSYADSVKSFWRNNSIGLLTAPIGPGFHEEARRQQANIANAIDTVLPQSVSAFNPQEGLVEPSFYSEMLGLQGRMDYLQMDFKVLLEQKSGKGLFPYDNFVCPKYKLEHYVQLLLYMTLIRYNFRDVYESNNRELRAFLMYSKYKESLLSLGFAPELVFRALKLRNELAAMEMSLTRPGAISILEQLTPETLNQKGIDTKLWHMYQCPQIVDILSPIRQASQLEKAYYYRFMTFIANEHLLSKLGNRTKENSGFASKWHDSLEEKLQVGNICHNLALLSPTDQSVPPILTICLGFPETEDNGMSNFRVGDIVLVYSYKENHEPDVRRAMVFRGAVANISADRIEITLRAKQTDAKVFLWHQNQPWAVEHDFMESSYASLYKGMHAFLSAPKPRRDLLLLQRPPRVDKTLAINGDYGQFNELSTKVKQARELFLIIGPPGTGKTSYGLINTLKEELSEPKSSVLLLSFTNRAVDEICCKLHNEGIDFVRIGGELTASEAYRDNLLGHKSQICNTSAELRQMIQSARVFVATTTSMSANMSLFQLKHFSLAIIDEASQILEPHLMGILSAHNNGKDAISKMVFIGDHKQLPAVVQQTADVSRVQDEALNEILLTDCRMSLFERLLRRYRNNKEVVYMLSKQGRMHQDIALFPNQHFYNNRLQVVPLPHQNLPLPAASGPTSHIDRILNSSRVIFLDVQGTRNPVSDKVNQPEADLIAKIVFRIYEIEKAKFEKDSTIGIIVPYRNQISAVRNAIDKFGIENLRDITIDTVERYQGSQRKYIIYGFCIQKLYQLNFLTDNVFEDQDGCVVDRKLNVAMTRAEEHLIMLGNSHLLSRNPIFAQLMDFVKSRNGYFTMGPDLSIAGYVTDD